MNSGKKAVTQNSILDSAYTAEEINRRKLPLLVLASEGFTLKEAAERLQWTDAK